MLAAGPAAIAVTRFHVGARQYASGPSASFRSSSARRAEASVAGVSSRSSTSSPSTRSESRAASWSPAASAFRSRPAAPLRGRLLVQRPRSPASTSTGAGRCMPGIFTKPPSGIAPIPYSIPFRVVLRIAGGNPM